MALTYQGSTAGATVSNPPILIDQAMAGHVQYATSGASASTNFGDLNPAAGMVGAKLWFYSSSNDATELVALNTINDGYALGMTWGDILIGVKSTAYSTAPVLYLGVLVSSAGATGFSLSSNVLTSTNQ